MTLFDSTQELISLKTKIIQKLTLLQRKIPFYVIIAKELRQMVLDV